MDMKQIKELMKELSDSKFSKFIYKKGDVEIHLEKETSVSRVYVPHEEPCHIDVPVKAAKGGSSKQETSHEEQKGTFVASPMVGTFYASSAPDAPTFVKIGDKVDAGTVVCIIEAMKVMNEVKAGCSGTVVEVLIKNGHPVEFGTKLLRII